MKLELKHLAPYLPYGLKIYEPIQEKGLTLDLKMTTYSTERIGLPFLFEYGGYKIQYGLPILRPLSDLTNKKNDKSTYAEFVGINEIRNDDAEQSNYLHDSSKNWIHIQQLPYIDFTTLIKYHFDVFDLIENGLAIDISTLNNE